MPHGSLTIPWAPVLEPEPAQDAGEGRRHIWYGRSRGAVPDRPAPATVSLDDELIERFRRGDREAFLAVHDAHAAAIARRVGRFFPQPFDGEEANQEVWMQVHRVVGTFDPARGGLLAWLRTVAGNRCLELLRALRRRISTAEDLDDHQELPSGGEGPEQAARLARLRAAVDRFKTKLTPKEATVLRLALIEEQPLEVIAAAVGASTRHCRYVRKTVLDRARCDPDLRAVLDELVEP